MGEAHEVVTPREENREDGGHQKRPFHRAFYYKQAEYEEEHYDGADIHGTGCAGLVAPVHADAVVVLRVLPLLHGDVALRQGHGRTALGIGDKESECLVDAIGPLGDVFGGESALC